MFIVRVVEHWELAGYCRYNILVGQVFLGAACATAVALPAADSYRNLCCTVVEVCGPLLHDVASSA